MLSQISYGYSDYPYTRVLPVTSCIVVDSAPPFIVWG
jgi:hypothetical protein